MENNNEITIKINISDSLVTKVANVLLLSSATPPVGVLMPQAKAALKQEKPTTSIGFKK